MTFEERREVIVRAAEAGAFDGMHSLWWCHDTEAVAVERADDEVARLLGEVPRNERAALILDGIYGMNGPAMQDDCTAIVERRLREMKR